MDHFRSQQPDSAVAMFAVVPGKEILAKRASILDGAEAVAWQKVAVKPKSWYLLSGWVKTEKVVVKEKGGTMGASLSIWGGYEASRSLVGTNGWTFVTLRFGSGELKRVYSGVGLCEGSNVYETEP